MLWLFPKVLAGNTANITAALKKARENDYVFKSLSGCCFSPILDLMEEVRRWFYILTTPKFKLE